MKQVKRSLFFITLPLCTIGCFAFTGTVRAQVTSDGTLPTPTTVNTQGNNFTINGGTQAGGNLFHSFREFSVPNGGEAFFNNAPTIQNIISRVTGGSVSDINGLIRANGSANLFLLNPAGIIFGPNARLQIGGSFLASTASSLLFNNGLEEFKVNPQESSLLSINIPTGLRFRDNPQPGSITSQSANLQIPSGNSFALVGGDVRLDGAILEAKGGRVEFAGVKGTGEVGLLIDGKNLRLSFPNGVQRADISLRNRTNVDVRAEGGGSITINAQNIDILENSILQTGIRSGLGSSQTQAGDIKLDATEAINLNKAFVWTTAESGSVGNSGNLQIQAKSIFVADGSQLKVSTLGQGNAGKLTIEARETVDFKNGAFAYSQVEKGGLGNGGEIRISTGSLSLTNDSFLGTNTLGEGNAGTLRIAARDTVSLTNGSGIFTNVEPNAVGNGNDLLIQARSVSVANGSFLTATTLGRGDAGNVIIEARETVDFKDGASAYSQVEKGGLGNGGEIRISTGSLSLTNDSSLRTNTLGEGNAGTLRIAARDTVSLTNGSGIFTNVEPNAVGNGNNLQIQAKSVSVANKSFLTATTLGRGDAGNVIIEAETVRFETGTANSSVGLNDAPYRVGEGNAGTISISTGSLQLANDAQLLANSYVKGNAGNVNIEARDTISLSNKSYIFSQVVGETTIGNGGNINISTRSLDVASGSVLGTDTFGRGNGGNISIKARDTVSFLTEGGAYSLVKIGAVGNGGNIDITTGSLILADGSFMAASTEGRGNAGTVTITATDSISLDGVNQKDFSGGIYSEVASEGIGNGGKINISTRSLKVTNGARINTATYGQGNAESMNINATDFISFDGAGRNGVQSGAYSSVGVNGAGNANDINITARSLSLTNSATLSANSSVDNYAAGNITVRTTKDILLDNKASIRADTRGGEGNITLDARDLILRRNSDIKASATGSANGGNITINVPKGFIIATPKQDSDIIARAQSGNGGNITIQRLGLFGIAKFEPIDPNATSDENGTNDIDVRSERGLEGTVNINSPNVDPSQGLVELPETVIDPTQQVAQNPCQRGVGSTFVITGRGGVPSSPNQAISSDNVRVDLVQPVASTGSSNSASTKKPSTTATVKQIVPAQGWIFNEKGEVVLTAYDPTRTGSQRNWQKPASCAVR